MAGDIIRAVKGGKKKRRKRKPVGGQGFAWVDEEGDGKLAQKCHLAQWLVAQHRDPCRSHGRERLGEKMIEGIGVGLKNAASPSPLASDSRDRSSVACLVEGLEGDDFEKLG